MDLTRGVSIVIPLRVDNPERAENLRFILSLLLQQTEVSVDILEADTEQRFYLILEDFYNHFISKQF